MIAKLTKTIRRVSGLFSLVAVAVIVSSSSITQATPANTLDSPVTLWPTPGQGSSVPFWWSYKWNDGPISFCARDGATRNTAIVAQYLNDGAYSNDASLLSFSFFKDDPCAYWGPNDNTLLRWYAKKMVNSNTRIYDSDPSNTDNFADQFFSFRGASIWRPYRGGASATGISDSSRTTTNLYNASNALVRQIKGRYAVNINGAFTYDGGYTYTYNNGDNAQVPNFFIFPNRKIEKDIVLTRNAASRTTPVTSGPKYYRYWTNDWNLQKSGAVPPTVYDNKSYVAYMRKTSVSWCESTNACKPVYYVAYSETNDDPSVGPVGTGACEEWWYAQDIGPIYISAYGYPGDASRPKSGLLTTAECKNAIALNKTVFTGAGVARYIDFPEQYFSTNPSNLLGWLKQDARCVATTCRVDY